MTHAGVNKRDKEIFKEYPNMAADYRDMRDRKTAKIHNLDYERIKALRKDLRGSGIKSESDREFYIDFNKKSFETKLDDNELDSLYQSYLNEPIPHPHKTMDIGIKRAIVERGNAVALSGEQGKIHKDWLESNAKMQGREVKKQDPEKLAVIKEKTIRKVDNYTKLKAFKELSEDKQRAILHLKEIKPAPMPEGVSRDNLDNLMQHFSGKLDEEQRKIYSKLIDDTKANADIKLDTQRDGQMRKAYIKAYQHEETHDLYYIYITQDNDRISVTGFPMTKLKDVISQIRNSTRVVS